MRTDRWGSSHYTDPLWRITLEVTDVENELLASWPVRRLALWRTQAPPP